MTFTKKQYQFQYGKYDLDSERVFTLSDLQVPQRNILKYEPEARILAPGLKGRDGTYLTKDTYDALPDSEKDIQLVESCKYIIQQYRKEIEDNIDEFDTFLDLGDFVFNISTDKIKFLEENGLITMLTEVFDYLKSKGKKRILVLGNHDKAQFSKFYYGFFDEYRDFATQFDTDGTLRLYTHYPVCQAVWDHTQQKCIPTDKDPFYIRKAIANGLPSRNVINIHGHVHSSRVYPDTKIPGVQYNNRCIDAIISSALCTLF